MTILIDGKKLQKEILSVIKDEVATLSFQPVFCDVLVGEDPVSAQYVRMKKKMAESVGILFHPANLPSSITTEELVEEIEKLNKIPNMCGVIVQLPLPEHLDNRIIFDAVNPMIDVDCLGTMASEAFYGDQEGKTLGFPTALACVHILDSLNLDLSNKKIVIIGQGMLVGKPVNHILNSRGLNVTPVVRQTEDKDKLIKEADIIISGTGHSRLIKGDMIKQDAVLIDAGTSESKGGIVGDVDLESVMGIASCVSPVPGGVGPVTVAMLLGNVLKVAKQLSNNVKLDK